MEFYRKERFEVFKRRFTFNQESNRWEKKGDVVFQAKLRANDFSKKVKIKKDNSATIDVYYGYTDVNKLRIEYTRGSRSFKFNWSESDLKEIINNNLANYSFRRKIVENIMKIHTRASTNSPLISGCIVKDYVTENSFPGRVLKLNLREREPIENKWCSGNEKEFFLIGKVSERDCDGIVYLGGVKNTNVKINQEYEIENN